MQVAEDKGERGFDGWTAGAHVAFETHCFEHAPLSRQTGRRHPPQRASLCRCTCPAFVCEHWHRPREQRRTYSAATGGVVFAKLGGRFSKKAENASLASANRNRSANSRFSTFTASLSWPIEDCLMRRLHARSAPTGFAASFCAVAVAVAIRSLSGTTRVTRPSSAARRASNGSPSRTNSAALRWPVRA